MILLPRACLLVLLSLVACAPRQQEFVAQPLASPRLEDHAFIASDGAIFSLRTWLPQKKAKAAIIALHGFNDYSNAFNTTGPYFAGRGIAVYAYDQRGFGAAPDPGIWAGKENLLRDLGEFSHLVAKQHPQAPLYILGDSMGAAVAIAAGGERLPPVSGMIWVAPAVWGDDTLNPFYRATLWLMAHTIPYKTFDGSDLDILASNNIPMLRRLAKDPLIIKRTRADAILGLVRLMDNAYRQAPNLATPSLLLYGAKDEVIPPYPIVQLLDRDPAPLTFAYYPDGYHMLLRDLQGERVMADIASWIEHPRKPLPSGFTVSPAGAFLPK
jgi:alpha-beta hydrolase superfamily lysophospholipase